MVLPNFKNIIRTPQKAGLKAYHDHYNVNRMFLNEHDIVSELTVEESQILDFGCGYHYPTVLFLVSQGAEAYGLDILNTFQNESLKKQVGSGVFPAPLYKKFTMLPFYYDQMKKLIQAPLRHDQCHLTSYDGNNFPYNNNKFNAIVSNGTIQHIENPRWLISELTRTLGENGYINLNFKNDLSYSATGTKNANRLSKPWGHLRGEAEKLPRRLWEYSDYICFIEELREKFSQVHVYLSDQINNLIKYDATLDLPFENNERFIWEGEKHYSESIQNEVNFESEKLLKARSFKIIAKI